MSKFLTMTHSEINELKGAALKEIAAELEIAGRSKMKADELREAIKDAVDGLQSDATYTEQDNGDFTPVEDTPQMIEQTFADVPGPSNAIIEAVEPQVVEDPELDKWQVVPNRKMRREAARRQRKAQGRIAQKHNHG